MQLYLQKSPISFRKLSFNESLLSCSCKKSYCLKKYCECYQSGNKCTNNCKCVDCHNRNITDKRLFYINTEKRERFYSLDSTNMSIEQINFKTISVQPAQIIINDYNYNNFNYVNNCNKNP